MNGLIRENNLPEGLLKDNERLDDLQYKGLRIIQNPSKFCFGTDAVMLAGFADIRKGDRVADLGTGTGIIPILLSGREETAHITGIEIQEEMADMAKRSVILNGLESRISVLHGDIRNITGFLRPGEYTYVISNPPYKKAGSGILNPDDSKAVAKHELLCTLEDVIDAAGKLLVSMGRFAMIHLADRLIDILYLMREKHLEPKRIRLIHSKIDKAPKFVLLEAVKDGKPYLKWMPPLFVYNADGSFTSEYKSIYHIYDICGGSDSGG